ncbi:MAG TPA: hypothetical protein VE868_05915 [Balneolaceae bacterium]|nr:hypothetical protein [Balneolaceae bacterium]
MKVQNSILDPSLNDVINDYVEETLDINERFEFENFLSSHKKLRAFVHKSKMGKKIARNSYSVRAANDFEEKLARRIARERESKELK